METVYISINSWMDKEYEVWMYTHTQTHTYTHTHTHTMKHHSAVKKEWNFVICSNIDALGGYITLSKIRQRKINTVWYHLYMESKKHRNLVNITSWLTDTENKPTVTSGGSNIRVKEWEVQTTGYKIGSRIYCKTQGTEPVFCNNCIWKVIFKR